MGYWDSECPLRGNKFIIVSVYTDTELDKILDRSDLIWPVPAKSTSEPMDTNNIDEWIKTDKEPDEVS